MTRTMMVMMLSAGLAYGLGLNPAPAQHGQEEQAHQHGKGAHTPGEKTGHSHDKAAAHGGAVTMSQEFHVETVFLPDQIRLYLYDGEQNPMHVKHWKKGLVEATGVVQFRDPTRGTDTLKFGRATLGGYACPMHREQRANRPGKCAECGMKLAKQRIPEGALWSCPMHPDEHGKAQGKCADCGMKYTPQDHLVAAADLKGLEAGGARVTITLKNLPGAKEHTLKFAEKFVPAKRQDKHNEDEHEEHEHGEHEHGHGGHDH